GSINPGSPGNRPPPRVPFPTGQTHRRGANALPAVQAEVGKKKKADDHSPARGPSTVVAQETPYYGGLPTPVRRLRFDGRPLWLESYDNLGYPDSKKILGENGPFLDRPVRKLMPIRFLATLLILAPSVR